MDTCLLSVPSTALIYADVGTSSSRKGSEEDERERMECEGQSVRMEREREREMVREEKRVRSASAKKSLTNKESPCDLKEHFESFFFFSSHTLYFYMSTFHVQSLLYSSSSSPSLFLLF